MALSPKLLLESYEGLLCVVLHLPRLLWFRPETLCKNLLGSASFVCLDAFDDALIPLWRDTLSASDRRQNVHQKELHADHFGEENRVSVCPRKIFAHRMQENVSRPLTDGFARRCRCILHLD